MKTTPLMFLALYFPAIIKEDVFYTVQDKIGSAY